MGEMPRNIPRLLWLVVPMAYLLYLYDLGAAGLIGPDEPRYASIGRAMAASGDWITPRLWGQPWFEKPALLYWMTGAAFRLGLGPDLAPRLPVALLSLGFLAFYWWILNREFGCRAAWISTLVLGTSAWWIGMSEAGVTDLPLAATFSAAMLLALPWVAKRDGRFLPAASALLGLAVLAKGLLPLVLAAPLLWWARPAPRWRLPDLLRPRVVAPFLVVALPWYLLCYLRNGSAFLLDFFSKHQFGRFSSGALMHVQPWWFYLPVLLAALLPWSPLLPLLGHWAAYRDPRRLFLLLLVLFGLIFFSAATNKLPGYLLPLLPAAAALVGIALDEAADARRWLAACALLLAAFPVAAQVLPAALAGGLSHAPLPAFHWTWLLPLAVAALAWALEGRGRRVAAVASLAIGVTAGTVYLKYTVAPQLDRRASARALWQEVAGHVDQVCSGEIGRDWRYGLNYYSVTPIPDCSTKPRPMRILQAPGELPKVVNAVP
jgi:4-amino-4-deoxy-L-arabinose transferase-like glycosyltransferase